MTTRMSRFTIVAMHVVAIGLVTIVVALGLFTSSASAAVACDNYRPSIVRGQCPVTGTISQGEVIYLTGGFLALGNEIGLQASRTWGLAYYKAGQPGKWMQGSGSGTYGALGSSGSTRVDPSCTMTGANVTGNCDVQYTL